MDPHVQRLIRELREEKCPQVVLDRVAERTSRDRKPSPRARFKLSWALAMLCLLATVAAWQWQAQRSAATREAAAAAEAESKRARVVQEASGVLAFIGQSLLQAAAQGEIIISKEAVPPLRKGFETVKTKMTKQI